MADNLTTATIDVRANTRGMERDILKALQTVELSQINTKKSSQALGRITGQVSEFNKSLEASNARVIAFGASAGAIFAVEKALTSLITSTIDVEKRLTDINVLLNLSSSNLEKFGNSLFDVARNTAQSFAAVSEAATELSRQGLGVEETLKRTNAALILTRLSGLDAKSSVEALTATLNSFSGSALDAVEVVNKLANVDAAFAVSSADLANAISRVGSTAVDAGVSLDELIALVTSAQQTTARGGAVIGNSFKTIFTRLQRGKVQDLLGSLGVETSEGQSAVSLLQQLATTYDKLGAVQKSYIAEQVGGVFQINILKAALSDLGKEYSIYGRALETSLSSTDQAIQRNKLLNETVAALSSQAVSNLEQAASKIGSIVFEPNAKGFLKGFNELLSSFNNIDSESAGGKLMEGFFKGISNFIGGPGAILATAVLVKLFAKLTQFAAGSAKELLGTNKAAQQQAAIEQSILGILQKNSQFTNQILTGKMTTVQAEKEMLNYLTAQSNVLREQERLSKVIGANLAMKGVSVGASGIPMTAPAKKTKAAASGYIPNFATDMAVGQAMENAGAKQHGYKAGKAKKTTIHDGNGKSFKSFVNSKEDVTTFTNAAGKKATLVRPPNGFGENTQYAAGGYIPNFIKDSIVDRNKKGLDLERGINFILSGIYKDAGPDLLDYPYGGELMSASAEVKSKARINSLSRYGDAKYSNSKTNVRDFIKKITGSLDKKNIVELINLANKTKLRGINLNRYVPATPSLLNWGEEKDSRQKAATKLSTVINNLARLRDDNTLPKLNKNGEDKLLFLDYLDDKVYYKKGFDEPSVTSSGFIPNFASMGSKFKAMYGGGITMRAVDKEKAAKKKNLDVKKLDLSDRYTMVHGGNQGLDSANVSLEAGNKLFDAKIATAGLNTAGTNLQRYGIKGLVGDALVGATNNIIKTFGGTEQITDASSLDNAGSVGSAAGTVFETALRKAFNAPAVSQTQRIDFPAPTPELKKFFHNAPGQYEAKISRTPDNLKSALKKWVDVNGLASSAYGYIPNFAKSGLSYSYKDKDEFGFSEIQAIMGGKKVGSFSYAEDKKGLVDVGDFSVNKGERGKGIGSGLYKEAIRRNAGKKMKGQLLPQMNRLLQKIKNGEPVSAETLYPQIKRADLAKSSVFEVYGHKGMTVEKMTRDQFSSFVNAKINELKKDPKKLQSFFGNVEADEYGGLGVDLQTQHASGFVPNFAKNIIKEKTSSGMGGTNYINKLGDSLNTSIRQSQEGQKYIGIENVKRAGMLMNGELTPKNKKSGVRSLYGNLFSDAKRSNMPVFSGRIINQAAAKGKSGKAISDNASNLDKMFYAFPQLKSRIDAEKKFKMPTAGTLTALSAPGVDNPVKFFKFKNINELINHVGSLPKIPSSVLPDLTLQDLLTQPGLSAGFVPNFSNALNDAIAREQSSGLSKSQIYVDKHSSLKNKNNPMGLMVANRRDEPNGGIQGIRRAKKEGRNPKTYGAAAGFVPNFANDAESSDPGMGLAAMIAGLQSVAFSAVFLGKEMREAGENIKTAKKNIEDFGKDIQQTEAKTQNLEKRKDRLQKAAPNLTSTEILEARDQLSQALRLESDTVKKGNAKDINAARQIVIEAEKKLINEENSLASKIKQRISSIDQSISANRQLVDEQKREITERKKAVKQMGAQRAVSVASQAGMIAQVVAPQIASFIGQDTQEKRGYGAGVEALGNVAGMAGTGAMVGGPWGAAIGAAVGALMEIPKIEKAFTSKMPELEKAVQAATENFTKFSEAGQNFLTSSENLQNTRDNINSSPQDIARAESKYADSLSQLPIKYQEQMVAAERLGSAQQAYAEILEQLAVEKAAKETNRNLRGTVEKSGAGSGQWFTKYINAAMAGSPTAFYEGMGVEVPQALKSLEDSFNDFQDSFLPTTGGALARRFGPSDAKLSAKYGERVSKEDIESRVSETYVNTRVLDNPSTEINETLESAKKLAEGLDLAAKNIQKSGGVTEGSFGAQKNIVIDALKTSFTASGGELTDIESETLKNLAEAINRPDQLEEWIKKYQSENNKLIAAQENAIQGQKNQDERRKREIEKQAAKKDLLDRNNQILLNLTSALDNASNAVQIAADSFIDNLKFQAEFQQKKGEFRSTFYEQAGAAGAGRSEKLATDIGSIKNQGKIEKDTILVESGKNIADEISSVIQGLEFNNKAGLAGEALAQAESDFRGKKLELQGNVEAARASFYNTRDASAYQADISSAIAKLGQVGTQESNITRTETTKLEQTSKNGFLKLEQSIQKQARNEEKQLALLAQSNAYQQALLKLTQIQNFAGGATTKDILTGEVEVFKTRQETQSAMNIAGQSLRDDGNISQNKKGEYFFQTGPGKWEKPNADISNQIIQNAKSINEIMGTPVMDTRNKKISAATQTVGDTVQEEIVKMMSEFGYEEDKKNKTFKPSFGQKKNADAERILEQFNSFIPKDQKGKVRAADIIARTKVNKELGIPETIKDSQIEKQLESYANAAFIAPKGASKQEQQNLSEMKAAYEKMAPDKAVAMLQLTQSTKQTELLSSINESILGQSKGLTESVTASIASAIAQFQASDKAIKAEEAAGKQNIKVEEMSARSGNLNTQSTDLQTRINTLNTEISDIQSKSKVSSKSENILKSLSDRRYDLESMSKQALSMGQADYMQKRGKESGMTEARASNEYEALIEYSRSKTSGAEISTRQEEIKKLTSDKSTVDKSLKEERSNLEAAKKVQTTLNTAAEEAKKNIPIIQGPSVATGTVSAPPLTQPDSQVANSVNMAAMADLQKLKKSEMDSLMQKYTKYGEDGEMTFNPRANSGFESEDQKKAFDQEVAALRKKQRGYTLENVGAFMPTGKAEVTKTQEPPAAEKAKQEEQKKPEANKTQDTSQLISNILATVNQIAAELQKQVVPTAGANGQTGAGGAVSVSTPVNLSINSTAGENKAEVANVADQIKNGISQFLSSPEFVDRVTTIAKNATGNTQPPKTVVK